MDKTIYVQGMGMRRWVLGDPYVDGAIANITEFDRQFQAPLACLGRMHEFEARFRGALRNGVTGRSLNSAVGSGLVYRITIPR